ncbi:MAG: tetratricopeptide repeat protein [Planctomycetota bacterium]
MGTVLEFTTLFEQAKLLLKQRHFEQAIALFEQAQQIDPDQPDLHEAFATACVLAGKLDTAIEQFQRITLLDPRRASTYVNLGALYNRTGQFQKAIEMCRRAVQIDKKSADGYYNLGIAHRKLNQLALAVPAYREAVRINPQLTVAHQNLGNVFLDMGNAREAIFHFKKALDLDPNFIKAQVGLEKAELLREHGKVAFSPFGRLVDTEAVIAQQQQTLDTCSFHKLTCEERGADHQRLLGLNLAIARAARDLRDQLKNKLAPEIKELDRAVGTEASFHATEVKFKPITTCFQTACRRLQTAVQELREYEHRMMAKQRS